MNRLALAFGIVCLLQGLLAEPRPEFGLVNTITASDKMGSIKTEIKAITDTIEAITITAPTSGYTKLSNTKTELEKIVQKFTTNTAAIYGAFDSLLAANDGNIDNAFSSLETAITTAKSDITSSATITSVLTGMNYNGIAEEFTDALTRVKKGLETLESALAEVKTAIKAAMTANGGASDIPANELRTHLTLKKIYDVVYAGTSMRSFLPLVKYIFEVTIENIEEADSFVNSLKGLLGSTTNSQTSSYVSDLNSAITEMKSDVADKFANANTSGASISNTVSGLTALNSNSNGAALKSQVATLATMFSTNSMSTAVTTMSTAFTAIGTALTNQISAEQTSIDPVTHPLTVLLVDTLMGNDKYGRYCYHKYKHLTTALFNHAFDGGYECLDMEYDRILYLKETLLSIIDLIVFDYEDVEYQVTVCNSYVSANPNDSSPICITDLTTFYTSLFAATQQKVDLLYTLATNEAVAIQNRLQICFALNILDVKVSMAESIKSKLLICSAGGPTATD